MIISHSFDARFASTDRVRNVVLATVNKLDRLASNRVLVGPLALPQAFNTRYDTETLTFPFYSTSTSPESSLRSRGVGAYDREASGVKRKFGSNSTEYLRLVSSWLKQCVMLRDLFFTITVFGHDHSSRRLILRVELVPAPCE